MSVLNRKHLDSAEVVTGTRMVQTYKIAVLGDGGVGKSGTLNIIHFEIVDYLTLLYGLKYYVYVTSTVILWFTLLKEDVL